MDRATAGARGGLGAIAPGLPNKRINLTP